ncbi:UNVERIFIED_CONTAM: hypothetical protein PYX00_000396 [Menopon gallinae]|uniref:Uncharacterized protein n=1 Tax=Menopon gallinae TaxID=328185 RepID=A0AAW2IAC7_9NEOP
MIGKVVVFVAVISCAVALPFGNCGPWENQALSNLLPSPTNIIPGGLNIPLPGPTIEAPAFPTGNIISQGCPLPLPSLPSLPPLPPLPPFPAPTVQAPIVIPRMPAPTIQIPNLPIPTVQGPLLQGQIIQNLEARIPTVQARLPTIHTRLPALDAGFPSIPTVQQQIFPAQSCAPSPFPC